MPKLRKQAIGEDSRNNSESSQDHPKNVIVFGESGVGKSSLINLLAGKKVSETSSGALGCTLEYRRHLLELGNQHLAIWDTAGLDEGTQGSVPPEKAEAYLKQLLHALARNDGVDLLVYCVRGTRVRSALLTNYRIFYSAICRNKVPIAIVITGLENQEGNMETWWFQNAAQFSSLKMHFDSHACVTTLDSSTENAMLRERREVSKAIVTKMITSTCRTQRWKPAERSWVDSAYSDIRAMLSPRGDYGTRLPTIIMCDASQSCPVMWPTRKRSISFQNPVTFSLSFSPLVFRSPLSISNDMSRSRLPFEDGVKCTPECLYRVYHVPRKQAYSGGTDEEAKKAVVKRGVDLLVFCVKMEDSDVKFQWEHFNVTYGGDLSPQIIVVVGAASQSTAEDWWDATVGAAPTRNDVDIAYWPTGEAESNVEAARTQLWHLIDNRCIDYNLKGTPTRNENLFKRPLRLDMSSLTTLWLNPENNSKADIPPSPEQDILTKLGVWWQIPERNPISPGPISPT